MSGEIVDLDILVPADKRVSFRNQTFTVPGDLPLVTYLKVNKIAGDQESGATEAQLLEGMVEALVEVFAWKLPEDDPKREWLREEIGKLGVDTITQMLGKIYPAMESDDEEEVVDADAAGPPMPSDGETTTTS